MNLRLYLAATVIITLFFALGLLLAPAQLAALYNLDLSPGGQFIARLFGATLVGWAALNWRARSLPDGMALAYILFGNFAVDVINLPVALWAQTVTLGGMNQLGWLTVAIYLTFTAGFGYYWRRMVAVPPLSAKEQKYEVPKQPP